MQQYPEANLAAKRCVISRSNALGTSATLTVWRKLASLGYRSSYSHCGAYYTPDSIAQYDELGPWAYRDTW